MDSLATDSRQLPARLTGSPVRWGADLAVVGGVTGAAVPAVLVGPLAPAVLPAALVGLGCGLVLGVLFPEFLETARRRVPLDFIGLRAVGAGAGFGALVGLLTALIVGDIPLGAFFVGGLVGALQIGWLWLPYTVLTVLERPRWPVVVAACGIAPLLGPLAVSLWALVVAAIL